MESGRVSTIQGNKRRESTGMVRPLRLFKFCLETAYGATRSIHLPRVKALLHSDAISVAYHLICGGFGRGVYMEATTADVGRLNCGAGQPELQGGQWISGLVATLALLPE